jgi:hypothetical protein
MDQRRHPRLHLRLPIRFIVEQPETGECQSGNGMLKNISYGGILFQAEPPLPVERGNIREFYFYLNPDMKKESDATPFQARGLVLRIEPPDPDSSAYGVAVQFLSALAMQDVTIKMTISSRGRGETLPKPTPDD